jgi:hypothetical protein
VLVLDRVNGVAYVALSERADQELAEQWVSGGVAGGGCVRRAFADCSK